MRRLEASWIVSFNLLALCAGGCTEPAQRADEAHLDLAIEEKVTSLLAEMTLEEKIGQMAQITVGVVSAADGKAPLVLDLDKLRDAMVKYHVGSIFNVDNVAISRENWRQVLTSIQDVSTKETRLGIPCLYGIDAIHGANYTTGATIFPHNIAMAATGNVELVLRAAGITAREVRASGIRWNFNPVLGLARQPLWPRFFETYGEDPYLASLLGTTYIRGLQGDSLLAPTNVAGCMKHYLGYSMPLSGRDRTPAWIPERMLRDLFLQPFRAAVRGGVATVMVNSSEINGAAVHASRLYLTDILRRELGFRGLVVTDWEDIINLHRREGVAVDERDAIRQAILAGNDMSMIPYDYASFCTKLLDLVRSGEVPEGRIDEAVSRILRLKFHLGLFANPYPEPGIERNLASAEATVINRQAAREAITLLENREDFLPLARGRKVLVTGPTANKLSSLCGGWTFTWQGDQEELYPQEKQTILEALRDLAGRDRVEHVPGVDFDEEIDLAAAVEAAKTSEVAIVCLGEKAYCEGMGNIGDLTLPGPQLELVEQIGATGTPIVLVLAQGRPRVIRRIADIPRAIILAYLPGLEGGPAIADVIFGEVNPSGKLPFTYPRYPGGFVTYDHKPSEESGQATYDPQWPFGHGLSYTRFEYAELKLDRGELRAGDTLTVSATVRNVGARGGKEIVQLYVRDLVGSVTRPVRQLKGIGKISLEPGEARRVSFRLSTDELRFRDRRMQNVVEPGEFKVWIAPSSSGGLEGEFRVVE